MMSWNSLIFCWNSSRVGKAISDSSLIGVPSCFSGGRRMVKCTRSTVASDLSRLRQVRSPACGSPETSSTRSLSRTPSIETTARLLTGVSSFSSGAASISTMFWPGMRDRHVDVDLLADAHAAGVDASRRRAAPRPAPCRASALVLDAVGDGLRLPDDAEARRRDQHDAAVALVLVAGDQRVHRRGEAERGGVGRHVVHAAVGDHDGAGDAVVRHVGQARLERGEQPRAVGLAVGLAGLDEAHLDAGNAARAARRARARTASVCCVRSPNSWLGLLSMTTAATEVSGSRSSRVNDGLASASTNSASATMRTDGAAAARQHQQHREHERDRERRPDDVVGHERGECDAEVQRRFSYCPSRSSSAGMWTWSAL